MHRDKVSSCADVSLHKKALLVFEYTSMPLDSEKPLENKQITYLISSKQLVLFSVYLNY